MANNVMREIGIVMGTWYIDFCIDSPATALEMARCRESDLDLREPPRQRRQKWLIVGSPNLDLTLHKPPRQRCQKSFLLPIELALDFPEEEGMMQQSSVSISLSF